MTDTQKLAALNKLLKQELGTTAGRATIQWINSDVLWYDKFLFHRSADPTPVMELLCSCGIDREIHSSSCTGLIVARHKRVRGKMLPDLINQIVLCEFIFAGSDFNSAYFPVTSATNQTMALPPGVLPSTDATWEIIHDFRHVMGISTADRIRADEAAIAKGEASAFNRQRDRVRSLLPEKVGLFVPPWNREPIKETTDRTTLAPLTAPDGSPVSAFVEIKT